jgi:hypothetical protein
MKCCAKTRQKAMDALFRPSPKSALFCQSGFGVRHRIRADDWRWLCRACVYLALRHARHQQLPFNCRLRGELSVFAPAALRPVIVDAVALTVSAAGRDTAQRRPMVDGMLQ